MVKTKDLIVRYLSVVVMLLSVMSIGISKAQEVYVKPGNFSYFEAYIPTFIIAGEKVTFNLKPMDAYGNFIKDFSYYNKKFLVSISGELSVDPALFSTSDFQDGSFSITIEDKKAGTATLSILSDNYPVVIKNEANGSMLPMVTINVISGPVAKFSIEAPSSFEAGRDFVVKVIALDKYGNIVKNYSSSGSDVVLNLKTPIGILPYTIHPYKFKNGVASLILRYDTPSKVSISTYEISNPKVASQDYYVDLYPPKPSRFKVDIPEHSIAAGEPFNVYITAYDEDGNIIRNYNIVGKDVYLKASGTGKLIPSVIPPVDFVNGVAKVNLIYTKSEPIAISAYIQGQQTETPKPPKKEVKKEAPKKISVPKPISKSTNMNANPYEQVATLEFPKAYGNVKRYDYRTRFIDGRRIGIIDVFFDKKIKHRIAKTVKPIYFNGKAYGKLIVQNGKDTVVLVIVPESADLYVTDIRKDGNKILVTIKRGKL